MVCLCFLPFMLIVTLGTAVITSASLKCGSYASSDYYNHLWVKWTCSYPLCACPRVYYIKAFFSWKQHQPDFLAFHLSFSIVQRAYFESSLATYSFFLFMQNYVSKFNFFFCLIFSFLMRFLVFTRKKIWKKWRVY